MRIEPLLNNKGKPRKSKNRIWHAEWTSIKTRVRSYAESNPDTFREDIAKSFCSEALSSYWSCKRPKGQLREPTCALAKISDEGRILAHDVGQWAATLTVDNASYALGTIYAMVLPDKVRSTHGVYYTPPPLVDFLLHQVGKSGVDWSEATVLDPACGGGAFLSPILRRMGDSLERCSRPFIVRNIENRIVGYELDAFAAYISLVFFDVTMSETFGFSDPDMMPVIVQDSLRAPTTPEFDLVIGNPPYGRVRLGQEDRNKFARSLFGHANKYGIFLDLALRLVKDKGVVAFVTPPSFLSGEYYKKLRGLLGRSAPPNEVSFVADRFGVFDDVLQETVLAIFKTGKKPSSSFDVNLIEVEENQVSTVRASRSTLPVVPEFPWIMARHKEAFDLALVLKNYHDRLFDWGYKVSTGPLVWNRHKEKLRFRFGKNLVPLIWAEAVTVAGTFEFRAKRRSHAKYYAYSTLKDPALVSDACVLLQRTTSKEQARRLIAAELPQEFIDKFGAVAVENHLNMVVPIADRPQVSTKKLAAFLNSSAADLVFRCISGSVAVSAYELSSMPLPSASVVNEAREMSTTALYGCG